MRQQLTLMRTTTRALVNLDFRMMTLVMDPDLIILLTVLIAQTRKNTMLDTMLDMAMLNLMLNYPRHMTQQHLVL